MKFVQQIFVALSLLALTRIIKADYLKQSFETASLSKSSNACRSQFNGTILTHSTDCQKFYVCVNQRPVEYNCDPNFHFDTNTRKCEAGAKCSNDVVLPASCVDGSVNAVEDNCNIFEICVKGQYQRINCPINYYFHAPQGVCVPLKFNAQFKCSCILPEHTVVPNENNCETYYVCRGRTSVLENCSLGQYYNSTINTCLPDTEGICLMEPTKTPIIREEDELIKDNNETDAKTLCDSLGFKNIHFKTMPKGCNTFYVCVSGQLFTQHCPQGFYYDSIKNYCVIDLEGKCTDNEVSAETEVKTQNVEESKTQSEFVPRIPNDSDILIETVAKSLEEADILSTTPEDSNPLTESMVKAPAPIPARPIFKEQESAFRTPAQDKLFSKFIKF